MHRKPKIMRLSRETLRALEPSQLAQAAAALNFSLAPCNPDTLPATRCGDACPTYSCGINKCF